MSLVGNLDLAGASLTSVTAYRFWHWHPSSDRDFIGLPITTVSANPSQQSQFSQELRLASSGERRLDYVLGAFYFRQIIDTRGRQVQGPAASAFLLDPTSAGGRNPATLDGLNSVKTIGFTNTSAALFGKLTWHLTDRLQIAPGLRLNAANTGVDLTTQTVRPEKVDHYELGLKTQLFDRRITANLTAFWTAIDDYQATVNNGQLTVIRGYLANAGKVRTRGIELDSAFRPTSRLSAYANAAYTDAKYVRFTNAPCPPELAGGNPALNGATPAPAGTPGLSPLTCDISGQWLPGVSKWAFSYGAEYNLPARVAGRDGQVYVGYDGSYRSKFSSNPSRSLYTDVRGYAISNVRVGFKAKDSRNVFGWLRNAFDRHYYEVLATQSGNTGLIVGQLGDPRTYGLTVSRAF